MARSRQSAEKRGHWAETAALTLLRLKGYRLLARRFQSHHGEVDLIMRKGSTTVFVEVKARANHDRGVESVTATQARRISAAAGLWMAKDAIAAAGHCRFDIVAVNSYLIPLHVPNAFTGAF